MNNTMKTWPRSRLEAETNAAVRTVHETKAALLEAAANVAVARAETQRFQAGHTDALELGRHAEKDVAAAVDGIHDAMVKLDAGKEVTAAETKLRKARDIRDDARNRVETFAKLVSDANDKLATAQRLERQAQLAHRKAVYCHALLCAYSEGAALWKAEQEIIGPYTAALHTLDEAYRALREVAPDYRDNVRMASPSDYANDGYAPEPAEVSRADVVVIQSFYSDDRTRRYEPGERVTLPVEFIQTNPKVVQLVADWEAKQAAKREAEAQRVAAAGDGQDPWFVAQKDQLQRDREQQRAFIRAATKQEA